MKIHSVSIKNFKSIKELEFDFPDSGILVLIGENNAGKSNIARLFDMILGESWYGKEKMEDHDFFNRSRQNKIEICIKFNNDTLVNFTQPSSDWGLKYLKQNGEKMPFGYSVKDDFPCTYLSADRTLDKHLSFYDWTLIGKIRKAFHVRVEDHIKNSIENKFNEMMSLFNKVSGFENFKSDFEAYFKELAPGSNTTLNLTFKPYSPSNLFKTMQIVAMNENDINYDMDLSELGEGVRNMVLVALLRSYAKNFKNNSAGILILEEPELYLHPQARRHLATILKEIAAEGVQIILSTHSDSFIDVGNFDSIGRVVKLNDDNDGLFTEMFTVSKAQLVRKCHETGVPPEKCTEDNISEFYSTTSNYRLNEGFFAKFIILVEGETEEMALPIYLSHIGIDINKYGISILAVNGKGNLPKYWRLFTMFGIPTVLLFDNDASTDSGRNNKNIATCFSLDPQTFVEDIDNVKVVPALLSSSIETLIVLDKDFENSIKYNLTSSIYNKYYSIAKDLIKPISKSSQKGAIARYIARQVVQDYPNFSPTVALKIVDILKDHFPQIAISTTLVSQLTSLDEIL